jgi:hypothetical protein
MMAVYAIVGGNTTGWLTTETLGLLIGAVILFAIFVYTESRVRAPLVPMDIFKVKNIASTSIVGILWSAAMFAWFFLSALYMQLVLNYTPLEVGLAFLPANLIMAVFSLGLSARLVMRFGIKENITIGMVLVALGLGFFSFAALSANFIFGVLPGMVLLGLGAGMAFNPVLLAGTAFVPQNESGLASGVLNTSFMMGGSLGLAVLASIAGSVSAASLASGIATPVALLSGYHIAFMVGASFALLAALVSWYFVKGVTATPKALH